MQAGVGTNRYSYSYSYSFGDPVNGIDPTGHSLKSDLKETWNTIKDVFSGNVTHVGNSGASHGGNYGYVNAGGTTYGCFGCSGTGASGAGSVNKAYSELATSSGSITRSTSGGAAAAGSAPVPSSGANIGKLLGKRGNVVALFLSLLLGGEPSEPPEYGYHYTSAAGLTGILAAQAINPSLKLLNPKDARHGDGVYFTTIDPIQNLSRAQISRQLFGVPWMTDRVAAFVTVRIDGLNVLRIGSTILVPTSTPMNIGDRLAGYGLIP